jgi:hypothetical protein
MNNLPDKLPVISIICYKWDSQKPTRITETYNLDDFSFWQKSSIKEACIFGSRLIASRTPMGTAQTITGSPNKEKGPMDDYITHVKVRGDGKFNRIKIKI